MEKKKKRKTYKRIKGEGLYMRVNMHTFTADIHTWIYIALVNS